MDDSTAQMLQLLVLVVLSLPACLGVVYWRLKSGSFLPYTRRWPVPWGALGAVLALSFLVLSILQAAQSQPPMDELAASRHAFSAKEYVLLSLSNAVIYFGFVAAVGWLLTRTGAALTDLGLPADYKTLLGDLRIGVVTGLAALLPVYGLLLLMVYLFGVGNEHPTLTSLVANPSPLVFFATLLTAGLAGPVFEEFVFRLLFQGWLERVEDESLVMAGRMTVGGQEDPHQQHQPPEASAASTLEETLEAPGSPPYAAQRAQASRWLRCQGEPPAAPDETIAGLPHGWGPIMISSFVFALVHLNQGAAPAPLFVFALMLGYVYQRTHRLTPSIFAHMTFNLFSLALTWCAALTG